MNDDLIKRSDAIGAINNHCENECYYRVDSWCPQCQREEFEEAIKAVPSADRPQEWISCSERLPEEEGEYLVTAKMYAFDSSYYDVQIAYCSPNKKWFRISNCEIVAWMPRPKPWKGADDE